MTIGPGARATAARVVAAVRLEGRSLDAPEQQNALDRLPGRDRAFAQALIYAALRRGLATRIALGRLLQRPLPAERAELAVALECGLAELWELATPVHAAVSAQVEAVRALGYAAYAGLTNAILRRFDRERGELMVWIERRPEGRWRHPRWLIEAIERAWPEDAATILRANLQPAPLWLRVNTRRIEPSAYLALLPAELGAIVPDPARPEAIRLSRPEPLERLPGYAEGWISAQDGAAMWAARLLDVAPGLRILDACAAPGNKTAHIAERALEPAELVAVELDPRRATQIERTLARLGHRARIVVGDARRPESWWDGIPFDRILIDAPCSGTGVIRRHPDILYLRRAADVAAYVERQLALLEACWPMLAPGGRLVYATCSILPEENQALVERFLSRHAAAVLPWPGPSSWGRAAGPGRQNLPGAGGEDGFYYAVLQRS
jgi:16S rRNA (cytosine967-C5)-methyltransferase